MITTTMDLMELIRKADSADADVDFLREGIWLLAPRRRAERALSSVVMQAYVEGVSARRVDDLARSIVIEGISKSQVSTICRDLDELVESWRTRPLEDSRICSCGSTPWRSKSGRAAGS